MRMKYAYDALHEFNTQIDHRQQCKYWAAFIWPDVALNGHEQTHTLLYAYTMNTVRYIWDAQ